MKTAIITAFRASAKLCAVMEKTANRLLLSPYSSKSLWRLAKISLLTLIVISPSYADWRLVGEGDCPGQQIQGSAGETPDNALCTTEFAGKTALCFPFVCNPGCQYIDVKTQACQGGTELAKVYTCEPE